MSDFPTPYEQRYTQALHRYTAALEHGDIETVAAIMRDAEQDPHLEQLVLDANTLYQRKNSIAVSRSEVEQAQALLLNTFASYESEEFQEDTNMYSSEKLPVPVNSHISTQKGRIKSMSDTTLSKPRKPQETTRRLHRISGYIQTLAAVLVVGILIGGFALLFASRHNTTTGSGILGSGHATLTHSILVTSTEDGTIYGTRPDTGAVAWHYATGKSVIGGFSSALVVQGQVVYFVDNGQLYALHANNGTLLWHKNLDLPRSQQNSYTKIIVDRGVVFVGGTVYGAGSLGNMYALRERDGAILWQYRSDDNPLLAANNGVVYVAKAADKQGKRAIQALQGSDGNALWSYTTDPIEVVTANDTTYVYSAHIQVKGDMGGNKEYKSLLALDSKGTLLWSKPVIDDGVSPLAITHEVVILGGIDKNTYRACAYRRADGSQAWCTSSGVAPNAGNVTVATVTSDSVYYSYPTSLSNNAFLVTGYNVNDGSLRWSVHLTTDIGFVVAVSMINTVYVLTDHKVYALDASNGHIHWQLSNKASSFTSFAVGSW